MNEQDIKQFWKRQAVSAATFTPDQLRSKAEDFRRTVHRRNFLEYAAGAIVIAGSGFNLWLFGDAATRAACLATIAGVCIALWQLHRRTSMQTPSPESLGLPPLNNYRAQLIRQRDALRSVWLWYILPLLPGYELFMWARRAAMPVSGGTWVYWLMPVLGVAVVGLNLYAARRLQQQIDRLDRETDGGIE